jgi:glycerol uptake facilitator-like aquaporin
MDSLNWVAIIVMTIVSFMFGHLWFGPLFGKQWMRIHCLEDMGDKEKKEMMKGVWKIMLAEFIATAVIMIGIARMIAVAPEFGGM